MMRVPVIDIMKGIAIIMIVNVHLISGPFFSLGETFHVISFFFTAGLLHGLNEKWHTVSVPIFIRLRAKRLLYPFLSLSICYIVFHILLNCLRNEVVINDVVIGSLIQTVTIRGVGTLWFLPVLFLGEVLFFAAKKKHIHDWIILIIGVASIFLSSYVNEKGIFGLNWYGDHSLYGLLLNNPVSVLLASLVASFFIELGYLLYKFVPELFREGVSYRSLIIVLIVCIISLVVDTLCVNHFSGDLHKLNIGNPIFYLLCSISGVSLVCSLSIIIEKLCKHLSSFLAFLGKYSLIIMTTHTEYYINSVAFLLVSGLCSCFCLSLSNKVISLVSLLVIFAIEFGVIYIVNHSFVKYLYIVPEKNRNIK